jgi:ATP-dependent Clp protease ATP-binding subunit ClpC
MSEFMERHNVSRLVGAPPGYIGYEEGGQLTEAVRRKSYSVVLLDEIEKAHPEAFNMLLQILDDGYLTDAKGRRVDFRNTIIIMTSNVGAEFISRNSMGPGFRTLVDETKQAATEYQQMQTKVREELKRMFRPEFLNRIDEIIVFHQLTSTEIRQIVNLLLKQVQNQLIEQEIKLEVTDAAMDLIAKKGYDKQYGARPLRRVIQKELEDKLAEGILSQSYQPQSKVLIDADGDDFKLTALPQEGELVALPAGSAAALPAPEEGAGEPVNA